MTSLPQNNLLLPTRSSPHLPRARSQVCSGRGQGTGGLCWGRRGWGQREGKRRPQHFCVRRQDAPLLFSFPACHYLCPSVETYKAAAGNEKGVHLHLKIRGGDSQTPMFRISGCSRTLFVIKVISLPLCEVREPIILCLEHAQRAQHSIL